MVLPMPASPSASSAATPFQRVAATTLNLILVLGLAFAAEWVAARAVANYPAARAMLAGKALFALAAIFWLVCGQARTSPGLALLGLRVEPVNAPGTRISLRTALLRPLPFFIVGIVMTFPVAIIPRALAPVQFLLTLGGALFIAANATPLWSAPDKRSLLDRWLGTQVVRKRAA